MRLRFFVAVPAGVPSGRSWSGARDGAFEISGAVMETTFAPSLSFIHTGGPENAPASSRRDR
jgi:hypothetical protein